MSTPPSDRPNPIRPLSFNSARNSPFRRQNSTVGNSPNRHSSPQTSPLKPSTPTQGRFSPERLSPERASSPFRHSRNASSSSNQDNNNGGANRNSMELKAAPSWLNRRDTSNSNLSDLAPPPLSPSRTSSGDRLGAASPTLRSTSIRDMAAAIESTPEPEAAPTPPLRSTSPFIDRPMMSSPSPQPPAIKDMAPPVVAPVVAARPLPRPKFDRNVSAATTATIRPSKGDPLSQIPPQLLHSLRESFSVLDTSNNGTITRSDLTEALENLGLSTSSSEMSSFFPPGTTTLSLSQYLNQLASLLAPMSQPTELLAAFSAFDDDDSGQIDIPELKDALLHTAPEPGETRLTEGEIEAALDGFRGRRAFAAKKGMMGGGAMAGAKKGEVFRYREFVEGITGGNGGDKVSA